MPGAICNSRKNHEMSPLPRDEARFHSIAFRAILWSPSNTQGVFIPLMELQRAPCTLSQFKKDSDVTAGMRNRSVYPKSTRDQSQFPCSGFRAIPQPTSYTTSGLTFFRRFQRFPETPVSSLEEHQFQHSKSRKAPCTPYRLELRADSLALTEEESQLFTST